MAAGMWFSRMRKPENISIQDVETAPTKVPF